MAYEHKSLRHWIQSKVELTHESTSRIWPYLVTFRGVLLCSRGILYPCFCSWFLTLNFLLQARPQILGSSFSGKNIIFPSLSTTIGHQVLDLPSDCSSGLLPEGPALCLRGRNGKKMVSIKSLVPNCILACWSLLWSHLCNCLYRNPQGLCTADYVLWNMWQLNKALSTCQDGGALQTHATEYLRHFPTCSQLLFTWLIHS